MKKTLLLLSICLVYSCTSKSFDSKKQLLNHITDVNYGYIVKKSVNGYDFSLLYKPTDLLVEQELSFKTIESNREQEIEIIRKKYKKNMYFSLSVSEDGKEILSSTPKNRQEFGSMVNQLAFGMSKKIHFFSEKKDTLKIQDYIYPRMYGMSKSTDILLIYPRDKNYLTEEYIYISIEDIGIYTGEVKFKIPTKNINKEPKLINL